MEEDDSASHTFWNLIKEKKLFFYVSETSATLNKVNKGV